MGQLYCTLHQLSQRNLLEWYMGSPRICKFYCVGAFC